MLYDYSGIKSFSATLEVDDPGNCAILAHGYYPTNVKGIKFPGDYYMIVRTVDGITTILKWGPVTDLNELPSGYSLDVKSYKHKETSIHRDIQLFLNDGQKFIYNAEVIARDDALKHSPKDYHYVSTLERA